MSWSTVLAVVIVIVLLLVLFFCLYKAWRTRVYDETGDLKGIKPVPFFSREAFYGQWFEHGRIDSSFEPREMSHVRANYSKNEDGTVRVVNTGFTHGEKNQQKGFAFLTPTDGVLRVSFFPFVSAPLIVLDAEIDNHTGRYSSLVLGSSDRKYLWALSRSSTANPNLINHALHIASHNQYDKQDLAKFHIVNQK